MNLPDPAPVLDLIEAFRRSKTMFAAVHFRVFDLLERAPMTPAALAEEIGTNVEATERLLESCAGLGLLTPNDGVYANTELASAYLVRKNPNSMAGYIYYSNEVLFPMWTHLEDAIREGCHRWTQTFGFTGSIFEHFFRTDESLRTFVLGMHGFGLMSSPAVVRAFDLTPFRCLADLGGATGHLVTAACERYPSLDGILFDLDRVIAVAREVVASSSVGDRVECLAGNFFTDPLPAADLYSLGRILHDWDDRRVDSLLRKIFAALPDDGALLIAEKLLDDDKLGPVPVQMQSLNMLICTEGKERSLPEYKKLLKSAGFARVEGRRTGAPVDAILAWKN